MAIQTVNLGKVEKQLADLLAIVKESSEIVIAKNGKPIARLASVVNTDDGEARAKKLRNLKNLFNETQSLPQSRILTDDDILHEVEAYRNGK